MDQVRAGRRIESKELLLFLGKLPQIVAIELELALQTIGPFPTFIEHREQEQVRLRQRQLVFFK